MHPDRRGGQSRSARRGWVIAVAVGLAVLVAVPIWLLTRPDGTDPTGATDPTGRTTTGGTPGRGAIVVGGQPVASGGQPGGTPRTYRSDLYAHVVGVNPAALTPTGIERTEDNHLAGGGEVRLSLRAEVQRAEYEGLAGNPAGAATGAVVALDPTTGAVLASVSTPDFDPNILANPDPDAVGDAYRTLSGNPAEPLLNRAWSQAEPPGAVFSLVVAATAIAAGMTPTTTVPGGNTYQPPGSSSTLRNPAGVTCPQTLELRAAVARGCLTSFAQLGNRYGQQKIVDTARTFGFAGAPTFPRDDRNALAVARSQLGELPDPAAVALSSIGQRDVRMTPLQGALLAATVANGGQQFRPYLVAELAAPGGDVSYRAEPQRSPPGVGPAAATALAELMTYAVTDGTARAAALPGAVVGGIVANAQTPTGQNAWFIGYAVKDGRPVVAVAVYLSGTGSTGPGEAARIGRRVMAAATS